MLTRFTPAAHHAATLSSDTSSGFTSTVNSPVRPERVPTSRRRAARNSSTGISDGVPPPIYKEEGTPGVWLPKKNRRGYEPPSAASRRDRASRPASPPLKKKSQYIHLRRQNGIWTYTCIKILLFNAKLQKSDNMLQNMFSSISFVHFFAKLRSVLPQDPVRAGKITLQKRKTI